MAANKLDPRTQLSAQSSAASAQHNNLMLYLSTGQANNNTKTTNFVRDNLKFKQANQDANLQNVAPVTATQADP